MTIIKRLLKARKRNFLIQVKTEMRLERLVRNNQGKLK
jgi:hypothetical protein